MALLYADGFDHWGDTTNMQSSGLWALASGGLTNGAGQARTGSWCLWIPAANVGSTRHRLALPASIQSGGFGVAMYMTNNPADTHGAAVYDNGTLQIGVYANSSGGLTLIRGGTVIATSANGIIPVGSYFYLELFANIHPTAGYAEVRLNGNTAPVITFTGNTQNSGNASFNQVYLGQLIDGRWSGGNIYYDDLVTWDTTGTVNNGFFGVRSCLTIFPAADTAPNNWATTNANHYSTMRNVPPNIAQYISGVNVGDQQAVTFDQLANTAIAAIGGITVYKKINTSDPGSGSSKISISNAKGSQDGQTNFPSNTPIWYQDTFQKNADGSPFTRLDINGLVGTATRVS